MDCQYLAHQASASSTEKIPYNSATLNNISVKGDLNFNNIFKKSAPKLPPQCNYNNPYQVKIGTDFELTGFTYAISQ